MAVIRRNVLTSPDTPTYVAGVLALSRRGTSITPAQINGSTIVQRVPDARILGTATELGRPLSWWDLFAWWHVAAIYWPTPGGAATARTGGPSSPLGTASTSAA
jgi:hypothetical protein